MTGLVGDAGASIVPHGGSSHSASLSHAPRCDGTAGNASKSKLPYPTPPLPLLSATGTKADTVLVWTCGGGHGAGAGAGVAGWAAEGLSLPFESSESGLGSVLRR